MRYKFVTDQSSNNAKSENQENWYIAKVIVAILLSHLSNDVQIWIHCWLKDTNNWVQHDHFQSIWHKSQLSIDIIILNSILSAKCDYLIILFRWLFFYLIISFSLTWWVDLIRLVELILVSLGKVRMEQVRIDQVRIDQVRIGRVRTKQVIHKMVMFKEGK